MRREAVLPAAPRQRAGGPAALGRPGAASRPGTLVKWHRKVGVTASPPRHCAMEARQRGEPWHSGAAALGMHCSGPTSGTRGGNRHGAGTAPRRLRGGVFRYITGVCGKHLFDFFFNAQKEKHFVILLLERLGLVLKKSAVAL